jgi:hypothetical protein
MITFLLQNKLDKLFLLGLCKCNTQQERQSNSSEEVVLCANQSFTRSSLAFSAKDNPVARAIPVSPKMSSESKSKLKSNDSNELFGEARGLLGFVVASVGGAFSPQNQGKRPVRLFCRSAKEGNVVCEDSAGIQKTHANPRCEINVVSLLFGQGGYQTDDHLRLKWMDHTHISPRLFFNSHDYGLSWVQGLLGASRTFPLLTCFDRMMRLIDHTGYPICRGVESVEFLRLLPSPGSRDMYVAPAVRFASIFDRLDADLKAYVVRLNFLTLCNIGHFMRTTCC